MTPNLLPDSTQRAITAPNNLGLVRYALASVVVLSHIAGLTKTPLWLPFSVDASVKGFFVISGFLIGISCIHSRSIADYFGRRLRRLMPGYWGAVLLGTLIGTVMTALPLSDFLTSGQTWRYLAANLTTLNFVCPTLPGVFADNPITAVNGSLWTIKVELQLYLMMPIILWACRRWNKDIVLLAVFLLSTIYSEALTSLYESTGKGIYEFLARQGFGMLRFFAAGTFAIFHFAEFKRWGAWAALASLGIYLLFEPETWRIYSAVQPLLLTAIVLGVSFLLPYCPVLQRRDNISYGIYLYHFPIIQTLVALGLFAQNFVSATLLTFALTIVTSQLSWHFVEKRWLTKSSTTAGRAVSVKST
jgi:peptidoglycan/LPS O-acetylase OafA/YrhL